MPTLAEVLLSVEGDATGGKRALASIERDLAEFNRNDATAKINVAGIAEAQASVRRMQAQLRTLDGEDVDVKVRANIDQALAQLAMFDRQVSEMRARQVRASNQGVSIFGNVAEARQAQQQIVQEFSRLGASVEGIMARVRAASNEPLRVNVQTQDLDAADRQLTQLRQRLVDVRDTAQRVGNTNVQLRATGALASLDALIDRSHRLRAESDRGLVNANAFASFTSAVGSAVRGTEVLATDLGKLVSETERLSNPLGRFVAQAESGWAKVGQFAGGTRDLQEAMQGAGIVIAATMVPAIVQLIGLLGAAAAGAGAVAAAFAAAMGPAVALVIGLVSRFAAVLKAKQATEAQDANATNLSAQASQRAAAAEQQRVQSLRQIRDAQQGVTSAERALGQAREAARQQIAQASQAEQDALRGVRDAENQLRDTAAQVAQARQQAHQQIRDAIRAEADAERNLAQVVQDNARRAADATRRVADAQASVKSAAQDAYRAMADAIREARDAALDLQDAQLGVQDAALRVEEAQLAVQQASGGTASSLQDVQRAFEQFDRLAVDLGPVFTGGVQSEVSRVTGGGAAAEDPVERALKLKRALLELERAKLGQSQADARVSDAEQRVVDAQKQVTDFAQRGILAYQPYADAVKQLADAQREQTRTAQDNARAQADAQRQVSRTSAEAQRLQGLQIAQFPAVRSALAAQRDAALRLADAQDRAARAGAEATRLQQQGVAGNPQVVAAVDSLRDAHERLADAQDDAKRKAANTFDTIPAQVNTAQQALAKLDGAEQGFLTSLQRIGPMVRGAIQQGTDPIFNAMSDVLDGISQAAIDRLGDLFGHLGELWAGSIRTVAARLTGSAWTDFLNTAFAGADALVAPITDSFLALMEIFRRVATAAMPAVVSGFNALAGALTDLSNSPGIESFTRYVVGAFQLVVRIALQLGRALAGVFRAAAPSMMALGRAILRGATAMADFFNSARGQATLQNFFREVLPHVIAFGKFIFQAVVFLLQLGRIGAMAGGIILPIFTLLLRAINLVLAVLTPLIGFIANVAGAFLEWGVALANLGLDGLSAILSPIIGLFEVLLGAFERFISPTKIFNQAVEGTRKAFAAVLRIGRDLATFLGGLLLRGLRLAWNGIKDLAGLAGSLGRTIGTTLMRGLRAMGGIILAAGRWLLTQAWQGIKNGLSTIRDVGGAIVHALADAARGAWGVLKAAVSWLVDNTVNGFKNIGSRIASFFEPIANFFKGVVNAAIDGVNWLIRAMHRVRVAVPSWVPVIGGKTWILGGRIPEIPHLAAGGVATGDTLARIGEAGREAVVPLTGQALANVGAALAKALVTATPSALASPVRAAAGATPAGIGRGPITQNFMIPQAPAAHGQPDGRTTAAYLGREMRKAASRL